MTMNPCLPLPNDSVLRRWAVVLAGVLLLAGCATTELSNHQAYTGGKLPRPSRIIVHDYAASPADIPAWSKSRKAFADSGASVSAEELEAGRKLGADIAERLVKKINEMGMTAVRAEGQPLPETNDIVLIGYFTSIDEGSAVERVLVGFGKGAASVGAHAEGYRMTEHGLVLLGQGDATSGGTKGPGMVVPAIVTIATANPIGLIAQGAVKAVGEVSGKSGAKGSADRIAGKIAEVLQARFEEQGWI